MQSTIFFDQALARLKQKIGAQEDQQVADVLGMKKAAFSARKTRSSFPEKELRALAKQRPDLGIDVDYVLTGRASPAAFGTREQVGVRLRAERLRGGWSDAQMASYLGCDMASYLALEDGLRSPTMEEVKALLEHEELDGQRVLYGGSASRPPWELSGPEEAHMQGYRSATPADREVIDQLTEFLAQRARAAAVRKPLRVVSSTDKTSAPTKP